MATNIQLPDCEYNKCNPAPSERLVSHFNGYDSLLVVGITYDV